MRPLPALAVFGVVSLLGPGRGAPALAEGPRAEIGAEATLPEGDAERGAVLAGLAGCLICHGPAGAGQEVKVPGLGAAFAPPITHSALSPWTPEDWVRAFREGRAPSGKAYGPFFPWRSLGGMSDADLADIVAWTSALPDVPASTPTPSRGLWTVVGAAAASRFAAPVSSALPDVADTRVAEQLARGRYLVSAVGHCGSCHDGRTGMGRPDPDGLLGGGPRALAPNITSGNPEIGAMSIERLADALGAGEDPEGTPFVGEMATIAEHGLARLPDADRRAIAAWLLAVPAVGPHR